MQTVKRMDRKNFELCVQLGLCTEVPRDQPGHGRMVPTEWGADEALLSSLGKLRVQMR
jgi:hypothetical protein